MIAGLPASARASRMCPAVISRSGFSPFVRHTSPAGADAPDGGAPNGHRLEACLRGHAVHAQVDVHLGEQAGYGIAAMSAHRRFAAYRPPSIQSMEKQMDKTLIKVLLIEDNPQDARLIGEMLREAQDQPFRLQHVERLTEALGHVANEHYDVVLVDLTLPDAHGICTVSHLQSAQPELPIVVLTDENDENLALQAVQAGAQDYLVKGQGDSHLLSRALWYAIERKERQSK